MSLGPGVNESQRCATFATVDNIYINTYGNMLTCSLDEPMLQFGSITLLRSRSQSASHHVDFSARNRGATFTE